jgi:hypothetical protein
VRGAALLPAARSPLLLRHWSARLPLVLIASQHRPAACCIGSAGLKADCLPAAAAGGAGWGSASGRTLRAPSLQWLRATCCHTSTCTGELLAGEHGGCWLVRWWLLVRGVPGGSCTRAAAAGADAAPAWAWRRAWQQQGQRAGAWCARHCLRHAALLRAAGVRAQLLGRLRALGVPIESCGGWVAFRLAACPRGRPGVQSAHTALYRTCCRQPTLPPGLQRRRAAAAACGAPSLTPCPCHTTALRPREVICLQKALVAGLFMNAAVYERTEVRPLAPEGDPGVHVYRLLRQAGLEVSWSCRRAELSRAELSRAVLRPAGREAALALARRTGGQPPAHGTRSRARSLPPPPQGGGGAALKLRVHHSSVLARVRPQCVVFHSVQQGDSGWHEMQGVTAVEPGWLLEAAPHMFSRRQPNLR